MPIPVVSRLIKPHYGKSGMISRVLTRAVDACVTWRVRDDYRRIEPYLQGSKTVLDIGVGAGMFYRFLRDKGFEMNGVDVVDLSMYEDVKPHMYDGSRLAYKNKIFDIAILDRVLHHCGKNQETVLKEALRVAKRVVIIEDVYRNPFEKTLVALNDSLGNWEWYRHFYRDTDGWSRSIASLGGTVVHSETWVEIPQWTLYVLHALFIVDCPGADS